MSKMTEVLKVRSCVALGEALAAETQDLIETKLIANSDSLLERLIRVAEPADETPRLALWTNIECDHPISARTAASKGIVDARDGVRSRRGINPCPTARLKCTTPALHACGKSSIRFEIDNADTQRFASKNVGRLDGAKGKWATVLQPSAICMMTRGPVRAMGDRREMLEASAATCALTNETQAKRALSSVSTPIVDGRVGEAVDVGAVPDHLGIGVEERLAVRTGDAHSRKTSGRGQHRSRL